MPLRLIAKLPLLWKAGNNTRGQTSLLRVASIKKDTEGKIIFDEKYLCCWRATEQTSQTARRRSRRLFSCAPAANARLCRSSAQRPDLMTQDGPELAFDGVLQSKWI